MQVTEAAAFVSVENGHRVAMYRDTWPEANVRKQPDGHLQFFRHINSVISWPWSPTVEDEGRGARISSTRKGRSSGDLFSDRDRDSDPLGQ